MGTAAPGTGRLLSRAVIVAGALQGGCPVRHAAFVLALHMPQDIEHMSQHFQIIHLRTMGGFQPDQRPVLRQGNTCSSWESFSQRITVICMGRSVER